jgi:hypothetical protein
MRPAAQILLRRGPPREVNLRVHILNQEGAVLVHKNLRAKPDAFLAVIAPFRKDLVVAVECILDIHPNKAVLAEIRKRMELDRKIAV